MFSFSFLTFGLNGRELVLLAQKRHTQQQYLLIVSVLELFWGFFLSFTRLSHKPSSWFLWRKCSWRTLNYGSCDTKTLSKLLKKLTPRRFNLRSAQNILGFRELWVTGRVCHFLFGPFVFSGPCKRFCFFSTHCLLIKHLSARTLTSGGPLGTVTLCHLRCHFYSTVATGRPTGEFTLKGQKGLHQPGNSKYPWAFEVHWKILVWIVIPYPLSIQKPIDLSDRKLMAL